MKRRARLTSTSLVSILLATFHLTDDIVRGMSREGPPTLPRIAIRPRRDRELT